MAMLFVSPIAKVIPYAIGVAIVAALGGSLAWHLYSKGVAHQVAKDQPVVTAGAVVAVTAKHGGALKVAVAKGHTDTAKHEGTLQHRTDQGTIHVTQAPPSGCTLPDPLGRAFVSALGQLRGNAPPGPTGPNQ